MKKWITMLLALCMVLSFTACGDDTQETNAPEKETSSATQVETESNASADNTVATKESGKVQDLSVEALLQLPENPESDFEFGSFDDGTVVVYQYLGDNDIVVVPETWNGQKVTNIASYAFGVDSTVKAIVLPDSVRMINMGAFGLNTNLEVFISGSGLEEIGESVFQGCTSLHTVVLKDGLKSILSYAFSGCSALETITIPDSVEYIELSSFYADSDTLTVIGAAGSVAEEAAKADEVAFRAK